jgi:hypothetical protein
VCTANAITHSSEKTVSTPRLDLSEDFARFFEAPTRDKLRRLLRDRTGEFDHLDFKREWPERSELARDILGFANTANGCLVVGVGEQDDGTLDVCGLQQLTDKTDTKSSLTKYLPSVVAFDIHDFEFNESEYAAIKGKKFQVLMVAFNPESIPILATGEGTSIKRHHIYVRRDNATTVANHDDVQQLIEKRIDAVSEPSAGTELNDHLAHLYQLYERNLPPYVAGIMGTLGSFDQRAGYFQFIRRMIAKKEKLIERLISQ